MADSKIAAKKNTGLTAAQLTTLLKGNSAQKAAGEQYVLSHLGNEPAGVKVTGPGGIAGALDEAATGAGNAVSGAVNATESVSQFLGKLTQVSTWIRVLEILAGVVLLIMALRQFASIASGSQAVKGVPIPSAIPVPV